MTRFPRNQLSDDDLVRLVGQTLDECEPLPLGAVEFASQVFVWRDVNTELAQLLHDSSHDLVALRAATTVRMLVFQAGDITLDLEHSQDGLQGAVSPPAAYRVDVRAAGVNHPVPTDDAGMFEVDGSVAGTVQLAVVDASGSTVLVTPVIEL